jgi:hypothetical protein
MKTHPPTARAAAHLRLLALCTVLALAASGCFVLKDGRNHGIGTETNRANLVVYRKATNFLHQKGKVDGVAASRQLLLAATPESISISRAQRAAICAISVGLCLTAPQIGRTLVSWFRTDVRTRSDYWEALSQARSRGRCFAWTFAPSRNLTHKGVGTAGCKDGELI